MDPSMELLQATTAALRGRYTIERELGRGGMAVVYLARDVKFDRPVAVKVLRPEISNSVGSDRFLRETKIVASLQHPLIVALHDSGATDGLLWYVMPFVEAQSLAERLANERQLALDEAIRIAKDVGEALSFAHAHGVIHRDVKPGNILLTPDHACVADFGIAKALYDASNEPLTGTMVGLGTPGYMSPEQAAGSQAVDARTDIYGLAAVTYEMLAGEPVFSGTPQAIMAKQLSLPAPSVRTIRETISKPVDSVLRRGLARVPADRYATVADFAAALERAGRGPSRIGSLIRSRALHALALLAIGGGVIALREPIASRLVKTVPPVELDTALYAILPLGDPEGVADGIDATSYLHDALSRWTGVSAVPPMLMREALRNWEDLPLTHAEMVRVARSFDSGRFIRGELGQVGGEVQVRAGVYDATTGDLLLQSTGRLTPDFTGADSVFAVLVDRLLLDEAAPEDSPLQTGTRSRPSRLAHWNGLESVAAGEFVMAEAAFHSAADLDPDHASAQLWLAVVRAWTGNEPARWQGAALAAVERNERLSATERTMALAVADLARGDIATACARWRRLTIERERDFAVWFGSARCQAGDELVVPDAASPSGWSFRSSYHAALADFERAFDLNPRVMRSFRRPPSESLQRLFMTGANARRHGRSAPPDVMLFTADPSWADTLAFVPISADSARGRITTDARSRDDALRNQLERLRAAATTWAAMAPQEALAREAVALALATLGDETALDTLAVARSLARSEQDRLAVAGTDVFLRLALAVPTDTLGVRRVRTLADSLLSGYPPGQADDPRLLASIATLLGRGELAIEYLREGGGPAASTIPPPLRTAGPALLLHAALGGPTDRVAQLERVVDRAIDAVSPSDREAARRRWLGRSASLAFSTFRFESLPSLRGHSPLLDAQIALASGFTAEARLRLDEAREMRQALHASDVTIDVLYPEAELLRALGDVQGAIMWLDPGLAGLHRLELGPLAQPERTASLVRAMALRALLAASMQDAETAASWASSVRILWSHADPFLQPLVRQLRELTN